VRKAVRAPKVGLCMSTVRFFRIIVGGRRTRSCSVGSKYGGAFSCATPTEPCAARGLTVPGGWGHVRGRRVGHRGRFRGPASTTLCPADHVWSTAFGAPRVAADARGALKTGRAFLCDQRGRPRRSRTSSWTGNSGWHYGGQVGRRRDGPASGVLPSGSLSPRGRCQDRRLKPFSPRCRRACW